VFFFFFFNDTATTEIYTLSLPTLFRSVKTIKTILVTMLTLNLVFVLVKASVA